MNPRVLDKINQMKGDQVTITKLTEKKKETEKEIITEVIEIFEAMGYSPAKAKEAIAYRSTHRGEWIK